MLERHAQNMHFWQVLSAYNACDVNCLNARTHTPPPKNHFNFHGASRTHMSPNSYLQFFCQMINNVTQQDASHPLDSAEAQWKGNARMLDNTMKYRLDTTHEPGYKAQSNTCKSDMARARIRSPEHNTGYEAQSSTCKNDIMHEILWTDLHCLSVVLS